MKGKKTGGRDFAKGNTIGKGFGRPKAEFHVTDIRNLTREELEGLISLLLRSTDAEIIKVRQDPNETKLRKLIAQALISAQETGDMRQLDLILNRVIGKVKDSVEHSGRIDGTRTVEGVLKVDLADRIKQIKGEK